MAPSRAAPAESESGSDSDDDSSLSSEVRDWRQMVWNQWQRSAMCAFGGMVPGMAPSMAPGMAMCGKGGMLPPKGGMLPPQPNGKGKPTKSKPVKEPPPEEEQVAVFIDEAVTEFVPVPRALVAKVIGKRASTITEIRMQSGCYKVDARGQDEDPVQVKVEGTPESVKKARELIMEIISSPNERLFGEVFVEIPKANIGKVIGIKGAHINKLQVDTRTKIDIDFRVDPCRCYLKGAPEDIEVVKAKLLEASMLLDGESEVMELPRFCAAIIIGVSGCRLREIEEATGCKIDIDKTGVTCKVRLSGDQNAVNHAKQVIADKIQEEQTPQGGKGIFKGEFAAPRKGGFKGKAGKIVAVQQPASFPASIQESVARAKAAAQAVNEGLLADYPKQWWDEPAQPSAEAEWDTGSSYPGLV